MGKYGRDKEIGIGEGEYYMGFALFIVFYEYHSSLLLLNHSLTHSLLKRRGESIYSCSHFSTFRTGLIHGSHSFVQVGEESCIHSGETVKG